MPPERSVRKRHRLDSESSVKTENSSAVNDDSNTSGEQGSGGETKEEKDFWGPFKRLFNSPDHSDIRICAGYFTYFYGHSFVLKIRCPRLAELIESDNSYQRPVYVDGTAFAGRSLLEYIYTGDYSVDSIDSHKDRLLLYSQVYELAVKYGLTGLQTLCYDKGTKDWNGESFGHYLKSCDFDELQFLIRIALDHTDEILDEKSALHREILIHGRDCIKDKLLLELLRRHNQSRA